MQKMAQDSTPVLRESLEKCFIEQQLALKQLTVQYEDLEDKVELADCFYTQLDGNQEENSDKIEKLQKRVTELEGHLRKLQDVELSDAQGAIEELLIDQEKKDDRLELMEEGVKVLKVQNIELRDHLNLTIDMVNNVTTILNNQYGNKEQTDEAIQAEITTPHEDTQHTLKKVYAMYEVTTPHEDMCEDTQPTVQQVFAMYQSQPPDEEGWDEMTAAMNAAEEHEARKKLTVNGLTNDEWKDLLQLK